MSLRTSHGDFNTMAQRLGELDQMKKDFVSHVSHDLKGPLASTRETVHILLEEIPGPLNEKQRRLLEFVPEELRAAFRNDWKFTGRFADGSRYDGLQN